MSSDAHGPSADSIGGATSAAPAAPTTATAWLAERRWTDGIQTITLTVDAAYRTVVVFDGKGTMPGTRALMELVDSIRDELGHDKRITSLVDMRKLDGAPLRAQFILGKWLLSRKKDTEKIAVFGGTPFDMGLARAVMTIAGMGKKASFGQTREEAIAFLGWPSERYPR